MVDLAQKLGWSEARQEELAATVAGVDWEMDARGERRKCKEGRKRRRGWKKAKSKLNKLQNDEIIEYGKDKLYGQSAKRVKKGDADGAGAKKKTQKGKGKGKGKK